MNVLVDHHHGALLRSFYYLFKKRFDFNVYLPTGFEWLDTGQLYSCYPSRNTSDQMLNSWLHDSSIVNNFNKLEFNEFISKKIDIVVCSLLENYKIFEKLIGKYNKNCKLILHIGNNNSPDFIKSLGVKNLMSSSWPTFLCSDVPNKVFCRQEFSLEYFCPKFDCNIKSVASYKHIIDEDELNIFLQLEKKLPNWNFKCYGAKNRDGIINQNENIMSNSMKDFGFIYHFKKIDEGYGHIIHNAFACGKPVITNSEWMKVNFYGKEIGNTPSLLFEQDKTILDISKKSVDEIVSSLEMFSENYQVCSEYVYNKFKNTVDFDKEYGDIKIFISNLI